MNRHERLEDEMPYGGLWTWWAIRTRMEQFALLALAVCSVVILSLIITVAVKNARQSGGQPGGLKETLIGPDKYCHTSGCAIAAAELIDNLDETTSPCTDFYQFACGGWLEQNPIEPHRAVVHVLHPLYDDMNKRYRELFDSESEHSETHDPPVFQNIKRHYKSCMNLKAINELGDEPLLHYLDLFGGFPLLASSMDSPLLTGHVKWKESEWELEDTLVKMAEEGFSVSSLVQVGSMIDPKDSTRRILAVDQPHLPFGNRKILLGGLDDKRVKAYVKLLVQIAQLLGATNATTAESEVTEMVRFQINLAAIAADEKDRQKLSKMNNKMDIHQLSSMCKTFNWEELFEQLVLPPGDEGSGLVMSEEILLRDPGFISNLDVLIKKTPKRALANHLQFQSTVGKIMPFLGDKWRSVYDEFLAEVAGTKSIPPRWETCVQSVNRMAIATSAMYARRYVNDAAIDQVHEMIGFMTKEMKRRIVEVDWMDQQTRDAALKKLEALYVMVGFPPEILSDEEVEKHYKLFPYLTPDKFAANGIAIAQWSRKKRRIDFRDKVEKKSWKNYAYVTSLWTRYNQQDNSLVFPAGLFQSIFYDADRPHYLNYGAVGARIGHELTHAVDTTGRQYDADGNNKDWWSKSTEDTYKTTAACMVTQYNEYQPDGKTSLDGSKLLPENAADASGVQRAYAAYKDFLSGSGIGQELLLPGLNYTQEQLFFISYASTHCMNIRPEALPLFAMYSRSASPRERVVGTLSNLEEFNKAFNCSAAALMNRKQKCHIW